MIASNLRCSRVWADISGLLPIRAFPLGRRVLLGCVANLSGRLRLENRQHFLGKQPEAAFANVIGRAAEAEGDIELELAEDLPALFEPAQDLVRRAPAGCFHKAVYRPFETAFAGDLGLLLIGVVALHGLEVLAEECVVVEIALDEFALVLARLFLAGGEVGAADDELGQHYTGLRGAVDFVVQLPPALADTGARIPPR